MDAHLIVTYRDSLGQTAVRRYDIRSQTTANPNTDMTTIRVRARNILVNLIKLTGAQIIATSLNYTDATWALSFDLPEAFSNVTDDNVTSVRLVGGGKGYLRIPSPKLAKLNQFGYIPITDTDMRAYVAFFAPTASATISDGNFIDTTSPNRGMVKAWRASRRGRRS